MELVGEGERGDAKPFLKKRFCTPKNFEKGIVNSGLSVSFKQKYDKLKRGFAPKPSPESWGKAL